MRPRHASTRSFVRSSKVREFPSVPIATDRGKKTIKIYFHWFAHRTPSVAADLTSQGRKPTVIYPSSSRLTSGGPGRRPAPRRCRLDEHKNYKAAYDRIRPPGCIRWGAVSEPAQPRTITVLGKEHQSYVQQIKRGGTPKPKRKLYGAARRLD